MDLSAPQTAPILFWTITRAAALLVLATEGAFLLARLRESAPSGGAQGSSITLDPPSTRFFWAVTPAALLAGLSLWCLLTLAAPR